MPTKCTLYDLLNPNIDTYLNPIIPSNHLLRLPKPIHHFLGARSKPHIEPPTLYQWLLTFAATVAGLCLVGGVYTHAPQIARLNPPVLIASLGASAVLDYSAMRSPLAQPRNVIGGQAISAIAGVAIAKAFESTQPTIFANYSWVPAAIGCACASLAMSATNTVHPPGGATAVLASTEAQIVVMGWWFVPVVMVGSLLMLGVALLVNNLGRQYPVYWWTPEDVGAKLRRARREEKEERRREAEDGGQDGDRLEKQVSETESDRTLRHELSNHVDYDPTADEICIMPYKISLPSHLEVTPEEIALLGELQQRIRARDETGA